MTNEEAITVLTSRKPYLQWSRLLWDAFDLAIASLAHPTPPACVTVMWHYQCECGEGSELVEAGEEPSSGAILIATEAWLCDHCCELACHEADAPKRPAQPRLARVK